MQREVPYLARTRYGLQIDIEKVLQRRIFQQAGGAWVESADNARVEAILVRHTTVPI
jgi:hypothetical protein